MKQKTWSLILLIPLLFSCQGGNSTSTNSQGSIPPSPSSVPSSSLWTEELLQELQKGVKSDIQVHETTSDAERDYLLTTAEKEKEFSVIQYADLTKNEKVLHEYFLAEAGDEKNYAYNTRLDVSNTVKKYRVYNPATSAYYTWEDGFSNVFTYLHLDDFVAQQDEVYALKDEVLEKEEVASALSCFLYGNPGLQMESFALKIQEDLLTFEASSLPFVGSKIYHYTFQGTVIEKGEQVTMDHRAILFDDVEDEAFAHMLEELKKQNYTATIYDIENGVESTPSVYYADKTKVYYQTSSGIRDGFYVNKDNLLQEIIQIDGVYYRVGEPMDESIQLFLPSFAIHRGCFEKNGNVYTMKKGVEGDLSCINPLEVLCSELSAFTIQIGEGQYIFENSYGKNKTKIVISEIGTTTIAIDEDTIPSFVAKSWKEVLSSDDYNFIVNIIGEEELQALPLPLGYQEPFWVQLGEEGYAMLVYNDAKQHVAEDFEAYGQLLLEANYERSSKVGINEGILFTKMVSTGQKEKELDVELVEYEGYFTILIYFADEI